MNGRRFSFKIGTCIVQIVSFCFQIDLVIDLQIHFCNGCAPIKLAEVISVLIDVSLKFCKKKIVEKNLCKDKFKDVVHHW